MIPAHDLTIGWDYYGATVDTDPDSLVARLSDATQATPELLSRVGRWSALWKLHRGEDVICTVAYTEDRPGEPFFESKSHSPELVPLVRDLLPVVDNLGRALERWRPTNRNSSYLHCRPFTTPHDYCHPSGRFRVRLC